MVVHAYSPSYSRGWGRRIAQTWEAEVAVIWDHATALQPGDRARFCLKIIIKSFCTHWWYVSNTLRYILPGPGIETLASNPSTLGGRDERITWAQEFQVAVSYDCVAKLQTGQQSKTLSGKSRRRKRRRGRKERERKKTGREDSSKLFHCSHSSFTGFFLEY